MSKRVCAKGVTGYEPLIVEDISVERKYKEP
jgi:hypothetical protein